MTVKEVYFSKLAGLRDNAKNELSSYIKTIKKNAESIVSNEEMKKAFLEKNEIYKAYKLNKNPTNVKHTVDELRNLIMQNYIMNYLAFYDLLFINKDGDIFYTLRRQSDYHMNVFKGILSETLLSKKLKGDVKKVIVDFQNFDISGEPSAFFVQPVMEKSELKGWYVLQYALNKINSMLKDGETFGTTGEIILVNKNHYMITDSRFLVESTSLRKQLSRENIDLKFKEGRGNKIVVDYRGYNALTSFEVVKLMNSEWLLISKIDEDEILTKYYMKRKKYFHKKILEYLRGKKHQYKDIKNPIKREIEVDIDEYRRTGSEKHLYTHGVSKCTAVIITMPGKFSYFAHISANDHIYGGSHTDLIQKMIKRIYDFEVLKKDRRALKVSIITPEINYQNSIVDLLVDNGIFLSQIKILKNPNAKYANVYHDYTSNSTVVEWMNRNSDKGIDVQTTLGVENISDIMKKFTNY